MALTEHNTQYILDLYQYPRNNWLLVMHRRIWQDKQALQNRLGQANSTKQLKLMA